MWHDPERTLRLLPRARELSESVGELIGLAQCDLAASMAHALMGEWHRAGTLLGDARRRFEELGATRELLPIDVIEVLHHAACDRMDEAAAISARLAQATAGEDPLCLPVWVAVTTLWTGQDGLFDFSAISWLDPPEQTRRRWLEPLERLRREAR
jgi:hypothetical protein